MNVETSDKKRENRPRNLRTLSDYETITSHILSLVAFDTRFESSPPLDQILFENKKLIVVFNHASPISWIPAPCLLTSHCVARGGGGRKPIAVMDRFFYQLPVFRDIAKYVTQSDRPLSFDELVEHFETLGDSDLVVFPEGSNCFFGEPSALQPFRSGRFVEIAIRTRTPMLLCVHRGSEAWGRSVRVSGELVDEWTRRLPWAGFVKQFLGDRLKASGRFTFPLWPRPMAKFEMRCELHTPSLSELSADAVTRRTQVDVEAGIVHRKMEKMLQELNS